MLAVVRLVSVVAICSGLGSVSMLPGASSTAANTQSVSDGYSNLAQASNVLLVDPSSRMSLLHGSSFGRLDVPPWLDTLLQRVSKWLDDIIDVVAAHVPESSTDDYPVVVVGNLGPAPAALTVEQVEASLVEQTNAARVAAGLPHLQVDVSLTVLARQRSQDMIDRNFFSHTDPATGGSLVEAYCIAPLGVAYCGENLAGAGGLADAEANVVGRWLASDGHRENMLRTEFGRVGIGIAVGGRWGVIATQLFAP